jgi:hypothetical protein
MSEIKLALDISNTSEFDDLEIELWLDDVKFFDQTISKGTHKVGHIFKEDENSHVFKIVLKNKQEYHTKIDENNEIIKDAVIDISNICFDDINIDTIANDVAVYRHDYNGTGNLSKHRFYGHLGCNGEVIIEFFNPFYLWLLENM